ncbi:MAG: glyceraldehyde 3-phosphate dehydrogenase N-terminal domain-containing protein, partial [Sulfurovum sp.]|nr:glyceraldehyde 3-phosphate dehydrogenase N-terminal domain-containing protein [Sulfurovum sp.]
MAVKVAINGLGRIGRCVARIIADRDDIELVAVNASASEEMLEYQVKYDSVHGRRNDVTVSNGYLNIGKTKAKIFAERDLSKIDFATTGAELVLECTGAFLTAESVQPYLDNG